MSTPANTTSAAGLVRTDEVRRAAARSTAPALALALAVMFAMTFRAANAAHPLVTEDTGTQGPGGFELENAFIWSKQPGVRGFAFQPQFSWGLGESVDLILQPVWLIQRGTGTDRLSGSGDTALDAKWRFWTANGLSFGVRAGILLPTAIAQLGLPRGQVSSHGLLIATWEGTNVALHANLGITRNPSRSGLRRDVGHASFAGSWAVTPTLSFVADVGADGNPDPSSPRARWPGYSLAGLIYTLQPGLDFDLGRQVSWRSDSPNSQWLLGVTYRWTLGP